MPKAFSGGESLKFFSVRFMQQTIPEIFLIQEQNRLCIRLVTDHRF